MLWLKRRDLRYQMLYFSSLHKQNTQQKVKMAHILKVNRQKAVRTPLALHVPRARSTPVCMVMPMETRFREVQLPNGEDPHEIERLIAEIYAVKISLKSKEASNILVPLFQT